MLALCGKAEIDDACAPLNCPSQWIWGRHAKYTNGFSLRHTVVGYAIHHAASIFWAVLHERLPARRPNNSKLEAAVATSAVAAFVDYRLTPKRFTPGFEKRLSVKSLFLVYTAFAVGLAAAGALTTAHQRAR
jgi:hypothetical protein